MKPVNFPSVPFGVLHLRISLCFATWAFGSPLRGTWVMRPIICNRYVSNNGSPKKMETNFSKIEINHCLLRHVFDGQLFGGMIEDGCFSWKKGPTPFQRCPAPSSLYTPASCHKSLGTFDQKCQAETCSKLVFGQKLQFKLQFELQNHFLYLFVATKKSCPPLRQPFMNTQVCTTVLNAACVDLLKPRDRAAGAGSEAFVVQTSVKHCGLGFFFFRFWLVFEPNIFGISEKNRKKWLKRFVGSKMITQQNDVKPWSIKLPGMGIINALDTMAYVIGLLLGPPGKMGRVFFGHGRCRKTWVRF